MYIYLQARNISAMDVGPSRVVVSSADYAWYYDVPSDTNTDSALPQQHQHHQLVRDEAKHDSSGGGGDQAADRENEEGAENVPGSGRRTSLRGFHLPSPCVTEARFSGDEERCFFGTMSGHLYVVSHA